jgi:hypothetical protein
VESLGWPIGEDGGATLVGLAMASFVLLAGLVAVDVGALAGARAAAQTAADMAALAALAPQDGSAVGSARSWGEAQAAEIAAANGAELVVCDCSVIQAVVRVRRRLRLVPGGLTVSVSAGARAVLAQPPAGRAPVRPVDLLTAADGDLAERLGGVTEGAATGRVARQRERGGRGVLFRAVPGPISSTREPGPIPASSARSSNNADRYRGRARSYSLAAGSKVDRSRSRSSGVRARCGRRGVPAGRGWVREER